VAARSKAWVCRLSVAWIVRSYPSGGVDDLSLWSVVCCQAAVSASD